MAAGEHRVSRRVLLGAACAFPLIRHPGLDPGSSFLPTSPPQDSEIPGRARNDQQGGAAQSFAVTKWDRALTRFRRAEAALLAAEGGPDHLFDSRNDAFHNALRRLLRTPAPDLAALALKIDLVVDHEVVTLTGGDPCLDTVKQDVHRLAAQS